MLNSQLEFNRDFYHDRKGKPCNTKNDPRVSHTAIINLDCRTSENCKGKADIYPKGTEISYLIFSQDTLAEPFSPGMHPQGVGFLKDAKKKEEKEDEIEQNSFLTKTTKDGIGSSDKIGIRPFSSHTRYFCFVLFGFGFKLQKPQTQTWQLNEKMGVADVTIFLTSASSKDNSEPFIVLKSVRFLSAIGRTNPKRDLPTGQKDLVHGYIKSRNGYMSLQYNIGYYQFYQHIYTQLLFSSRIYIKDSISAAHVTKSEVQTNQN